jgi:DNA invertase Pin-like site-specific DNA recombinase
VHKLSAKLEADVAHLGYARVSSDGQSLTAQVAELKAAACAEIFQEKVSGAKSDRKQLARLIGRLGKDDVLVVTRLDRLARSTRDLLNLLGAVADKGAGFKSLRDTWADTTTRHGRLMLTVLGGLAEFERELIRVRTSEGRSRAKVRRAVGRNRFIAPFSKASFQDARTAFLDEILELIQCPCCPRCGPSLSRA